MTTTTLYINGQDYQLADLDPRTSLLDVCRNHLALTGSKKGCDHGQCGACTLLVNGKRINSCLTFAVMHEGDEIQTIESLGTPDELDPLQQAFVEHDAFQCGYCTSGQLCSAKALLAELQQNLPSHVSQNLTDPLPNDLAAHAYSQQLTQEIRERMSGNICRCSAYPNIVRAIQQVIEQSGLNLDSEVNA